MFMVMNFKIETQYKNWKVTFNSLTGTYDIFLSEELLETDKLKCMSCVRIESQYFRMGALIS